MTQRITKLEQLCELMHNEDWRAAILFAAKFQDLGSHAKPIHQAREAYLRPDFQKQLGKDIDELKSIGEQALRERYSDALVKFNK